MSLTADGRPAGSRPGWFLAVGFAGLAIALASIADMFSARPYDGIVPVPYGREGIDVRLVLPATPAEKAGIKAGECIQGIGRRIVYTSSDASEELRRHKINENVNYLVRNGPCPGSPDMAPGKELRNVRVQLTSERLGGKTYLYAVVVGFLFFLIGLFVFVRVPQERSARIFFLLCVLFLLFFVCRLRPASYWWIDVFVQSTGTVSLFLMPAVFLHFFLIFPRAKRLHFVRADEWTGEPPARWKVRLQEFLSASPALFYLLYAIPPIVFLYDVMRQVRGEKVTVLSGAPLSSWILLGDYLVLGLIALAHSAFTLEDSGERRQAFHVFVGTILGTVPFVLFFIVLPSAFGIDEYMFYGIIPMILIPLTFAYAIVRFQMLNVRVIVRTDVSLRRDHRGPPGLLRPHGRARKPGLLVLDVVGLAALQLRVLPGRHLPLRGPAAEAPGAPRQAFLPRKVRLPVRPSRDERGHHGRAGSRPHRGLPHIQRGRDDAAGEGLHLAAGPRRMARAAKPPRGPPVALGRGPPRSPSGRQAFGHRRDLAALR